MSKILAFSIKPHIWVLILFLIGLWKLYRGSNTLNSIRSAKRYFLASFLTAWVTGNHVLVNELYIWWEEAPTEESLAQSDTFPKTAVILGGYSRYDEISQRFGLSESADRFMVGLQGLITQKFDRVILTGGSSNIFNREVFEAELSADYISDFGVPSEKIIIDNASRNTYENAIYTKRILDSLKIEEPVLLVTSAFHMYRSKRCFDKAGVRYVAYPTHILSSKNREFNLEAWLLPSPHAMGSLRRILHEMIGVAAYKLTGKI